MNGGPRFKFTEAVSFVVNCEMQEEIDYYWEKLSSGGGEEVQCGWLTDKYGLAWQVVPAKIREWMFDKDPVRSQRVMHAVMQMTKLDIATLQRAYNGGQGHATSWICSTAPGDSGSTAPSRLLTGET